MAQRRPEISIIAAFATCGQALTAVNELARHGVTDDQLSVIVCRGFSRLTAPERTDEAAGAAAARLAGAVLAALFAASELCSAEVDALGAGPLMQAIARVDRRALVRFSLAERLIVLGFDIATAECIDASFCSGDIVLGVDTSDHEVSSAATRAFARIGARAGVAALRMSPC